MGRSAICPLILSLLVALFTPYSLTQGSPIASNPQEVQPSGSPVKLGDQVLFYVHGIKATTSNERAAAISARIKNLAEDYAVSTHSITISDEEISADIVSADRMIMSVFDSDARAEKIHRRELAESYAQKLRDGIGKYRQDYSRQSLFLGLFYTLIATLVLIAFLYLFNKLYRMVINRIQTWVSTRKISLHIQSFEIIQAERIRITLTTGMKFIRFFVFLVVLYTYLQLGLSFFPWTKTIAYRLFGFVLVPLQTIGKAILSQIPNFIFLAIIALITIYILKLMKLFFKEIEKGSLTFKGFYPEWAQPSYRICRLLVVAFAAVIAFPYVPGSDSPAFKGISIFLGVLFSLGSSSFIANILAGYGLTYRRLFKVGDRVKIADFVGTVIEMRLQVIHLQTIKNEEIIVPNSMIVNSHVINYSSFAQEKGLILHTSVTIGYDAPWRQVHAMLLMAAEKTSAVLRDPAPFVLQKSLDDFYVTYELNAYTDSPQGMAQTYSELHKNIQDAFNEHGVQIMSPHFESAPQEKVWVPKEQWYAPPAKPPDDSNKQGGG